jgi:hypothetical protein
MKKMMSYFLAINAPATSKTMVRATYSVVAFLFAIPEGRFQRLTGNFMLVCLLARLGN